MKLLLAVLFAGHALAQSYPAKPIRLVVGFAPGGAADFVARTLQEPMQRALGQPLVIDNKPGAGSSIAAEHVAKSPPDGYTVLIASPSSILVNPLLNPQLGYNAFRDLAPVTKVSSSPLVVAVNTGAGVGTLAELIAYAKKHPGKLNFASSGSGSAPHLAAVLFQRVAGVDIVHVPYKGGAPAVQSVLAGDTQLSFATPPSVLPLVQAGRLKALAVTSRERTPLVPGVPGMAEAGSPTMRSRSGTASSCPPAHRPRRSGSSSTRRTRRSRRPRPAGHSRAKAPRLRPHAHPRTSPRLSPRTRSSGAGW